MRVLLTFFVLLGLSLLAHANPSSISITGSDVAESIFISTVNRPSFQALVDSRGMTAAHKKQIQSYLALHQLASKPLPQIEWAESTSVIRVGKMTLDFAGFPKNSKVLVNSVVIDASKEVYFTDVVKKFERAERAFKSSGISLMIPEAVAAPSTADAVFGATMYVLGVDQYAACNNLERVSVSNCVFRSNASMIIGNLHVNDEKISTSEIRELHCDARTHAFKSAKVAFHSNTDGSDDFELSLIATRDNAGVLQDYKVALGVALMCTYPISAGKIVRTISHDGDGDEFCDGTPSGSFSRKSRPLKKGDKPKFFALFPLAVDRLEKCCGDSVCRKEIANEISRSLSRAKIQSGARSAQ